MFKKYLIKIKHNAFLKDNLILFIGSFLAGALGFFYHFYMGRILGVEAYGILGTILAGFYLINASFVNTLQTSIAKFSSEFHATQEQGKIKYLLIRSFKKLFLIGVLLFVISLFLVGWLSEFLHIEKDLLYVSGSIFLLFLLIPVGRGFMQGIQDFKALSLNYVIEGVMKLGLGVLFVYFGYKVMGAIVAVILTYVIAILFFWQPLKKFLQVEATPFPTKNIYIYSVPVFLMITSITLFFSLDVILVKHFFTETEAGIYSALSLLGKIIFFGTLSISQVMFPKVSSQHASGKKTTKTFYLSLAVVSLFSACALLVYAFLPKLLVTILFGKEFFLMIPLVAWFGLFISIITIVYLTSFYLISLNKFKFIGILLLFNILQIIMIYFYHTSISLVIKMQIILMALLLLTIFLFNLKSFIIKTPKPFIKKQED
tara:strand:+ start:6571 stop:7857 length:1287 start_codon:yes stop_codon:yes gene_type:complete